MQEGIEVLSGSRQEGGWLWRRVTGEAEEMEGREEGEGGVEEREEGGR